MRSSRSWSDIRSGISCVACLVFPCAERMSGAVQNFRGSGRGATERNRIESNRIACWLSPFVPYLARVAVFVGSTVDQRQRARCLCAFAKGAPIDCDGLFSSFEYLCLNQSLADVPVDCDRAGIPVDPSRCPPMQQRRKGRLIATAPFFLQTSLGNLQAPSGLSPTRFCGLRVG